MGPEGGPAEVTFVLFHEEEGIFKAGTGAGEATTKRGNDICVYWLAGMHLNVLEKDMDCHV